MRMACLAVHFGKEYLAWAVRGMQDAVDEVHIFYAAEPSYGYRVAGAVCPDSEEELEREARRFLTKPLFWHRVSGTTNEGMHRDLMTAEARRRGAEAYVVADADEVWDGAALKVAFDAVHDANRAGRWLTHFANFWQSFAWELHDSFKPIRIVDLRQPLTVDAYLDFPVMQPWPVFHFGYAQSMATMRYKFTCHSHSHELIPGWLDKTYVPWQPGDRNLHPSAPTVWEQAYPTDPRILAKVRELLHDHPYLDVPLIR